MLPRPSANVEEFQKILNMRFTDNKKCRENYERYQKICREGYREECDYLPVKMDYEVSSRCNFQCTMCLISEVGNDNRRMMSYEEFEKSFLEQEGLIEVKLQGIGEPLLNKDFFKMVDLVVKNNVWVRTTTNGSLLHIDDNYKKMIDAKLGEIQVSIDGATKATFEKIRRGSNFEQVVENVRMMNEYARTKGEVWRTSCWMLVQQDNVGEVEPLLELAAKMKFSRVTYSIAIGSWGKEEWEEINSVKEVIDLFTDEYAHRLIEKGKQLGIEVTFWDGKDKYEYTEQKDKLCGWLFSRAFIGGDMRICPCCTISDASTYDLGDAKKFAECWNGEEYQRFRKMHLTGNIPVMCRNCYNELT